MNKSELVSAIAEKTGMSLVQAETTLMTTLNGIVNTLKQGGEVSFVGFGRFGVKERSARKVRNPQTGKEMQVQATVVPFFKAGKNLKDEVDSVE